MVWGDDKPIDTTTTTAFDRLDSTMVFTAVGDEDLAAMGPTQTPGDVPPARHLGAHRKQRRLTPRRVGLTARQTVGGVAAVGAVVFVAVLASAGHHSPASAPFHQAAPEAAVVTPSPAPTPKPTTRRPVVLPAEPVVRRQEPLAPVKPVHTVTVTVTATPKATPTPKPKPSSPKPTASPTPAKTSPVPVETSTPTEEPTPDTETTDDDT